MECEDGDLIHADMHGACLIPTEIAEDVVAEAARIAEQEAILIGASKEPGFNVDKIKEAYKRMADIH